MHLDIIPCILDPVALAAGGGVTPNDLQLGGFVPGSMLLTGANMGGKVGMRLYTVLSCSEKRCNCAHCSLNIHLVVAYQHLSIPLALTLPQSRPPSPPCSLIQSTLLRAAALSVVMAQVGCYVPALSAHMHPVDRIFTRIGKNWSMDKYPCCFGIDGHVATQRDS